MIILTTLQDRLAFEIGAQAVERHRKEAELANLRNELIEARAQLAAARADSEHQAQTAETAAELI